MVESSKARRPENTWNDGDLIQKEHFFQPISKCASSSSSSACWSEEGEQLDQDPLVLHGLYVHPHVALPGGQITQYSWWTFFCIVYTSSILYYTSRW